MSLPVAILAGGLATRLRPITETIPKSLVDVAGRPFAEHQIELLRSHGLTDLVFLVGHLGEMVCETIGDGSRFGVRVRYVFDGPTAMGTGGAICRALPELGDAFLVLYGDSYLECDYAAVEAMLVSSGRAAVMTVCRNDDQWDRSNVLFEDHQIVSYDKTGTVPGMRHIDYGLGAFRASAFAGREGQAFDLASLYQTLLSRGELASVEVPTRFYEIGSPAGLAATRDYIVQKVSARS